MSESPTTPSAPPETYQQAVEVLLALCPSARRLWAATVENWETDQADDIGIYNIIMEVVQPLLRECLGLPKGLLDSHAAEGGCRAQRREPPPESDVVCQQVYDALELWTQSPDDSLRMAVAVEFGEGWGGWTHEVTLSGPAGPHLRRLVTPTSG